MTTRDDSGRRSGAPENGFDRDLSRLMTDLANRPESAELLELAANAFSQAGQVSGGTVPSATGGFGIPELKLVEDMTVGGLGAAAAAIAPVGNSFYFLETMTRDASAMANVPGMAPTAALPGMAMNLPAAATLPSGGSMAGMPSVPSMPAVPSMGMVPGLSGAPGLPATPGMPGMPGLQSMPTMPSVPAMPGINGMPAMPGVPGLQAIPAAAAVPGMPAVSGMPSATGMTAGSAVPGMPGMAMPGMPGMAMPSMPGLQSMPMSLTEGVSLAMPAVPGATAGGANLLAGAPRMSLSTGLFDVETIRRDFPILKETVHGRPLIWLDNAATTQKPNAVIDRIAEFYRHENSNIHRAAHELAGRATDAYEKSRDSVRRFINAPSVRDIVFVRGTTEGVNLVSQSWGRQYIQAGDEIILSHLEHHSNIVPWQLLANEKGAKLRIIPVDDRGQVIMEEYARLLNPRTKLVSVTHVSNALGSVLPVREITEMAHRHGAKVLVDGAQAVSHMPVDVQAIGSDWYVFSGHKVFGPTGIGVVYGRPEVLEASPPWQGGGNMIIDVTFEKSTFHPAPMRFEAGTGNIADAVGLGAALDYMMNIGMHNVARHEHELLEYGTRKLLDIPGLKLVGTAQDKAGVMSFVLDGFTTEQVGKALDAYGIAVRAGHHCAQPALRRYGLETSVRPSLGVYNNCADIDALIEALRNLVGTRDRSKYGR